MGQARTPSREVQIMPASWQVVGAVPAPMSKSITTLCTTAGAAVHQMAALWPSESRPDFAITSSGALVKSHLASSWSSACNVISGSNNLWFGNGAPTSCTSANVSAYPLFVNAQAKDFHIQSASPAKDAGIAIATLATDIAGIVRLQGSAYDIGAFEYNQGSGGTTQSACDLNGDGNVSSLTLTWLSIRPLGRLRVLRQTSIRVAAVPLLTFNEK